MNEDVSQVTFKEFHETEESIYPSLTVCFSHIYYVDNFDRYGKGINFSTFSQFLSGEHWDDKMVDIDYDDVTLDFDKYLMAIGLMTPDWSFSKGQQYFFYDHVKNIKSMDQSHYSSHVKNWKPRFYVSYRGANKKCLTLDIPYMNNKKVWTFGAVFRSEIFPNSTRPWNYQFGVRLHFPDQFFNAKLQKFLWKVRDENSSNLLTMRFKIQKLEIIQNRKTTKHPCNQKWRKDDDVVMTDKMESVGCKPIHWKTNSSLPVCKNKQQMTKFHEWEISPHIPACRSIQKILYTYEEHEILEDWNKEWNENSQLFEVLLEFQDATYMEIQQVRDYGVQDVVGDVGGYLGLFLGFALLQIPELVHKIYCWIDNTIKSSERATDVNKNTSQKDIEAQSTKRSTGYASIQLKHPVDIVA